jgi:MSHA pilin protein MshA
MKKLQKQAGFTLIELVVVIVILGILAATAAPKFIDLTGDAKGAVLEGVKGSLNSAADLAHAKALVQSQTKVTGAISAAGTTINLKYGWPTDEDVHLLLEDMDDVSYSAGTFTHIDAPTATASTCVAVYSNTVTSPNVGRPSVTSTTTGC